MSNNLTQQTPNTYGYSVPTYQRVMPAQMNEGWSYNTPMQMPQFNYIKGRPVVSIDEARASQIDLDGSLHVFPDLGNKKIYTKQINIDGTATFNVFELSAAKEDVREPAYVTKAELDEILASFKASLTPTQATTLGAAPTKTFNL